MKHPRAKGTAIRTKCKKLLESNGWLVDVVEKTGRFVKIKDLFGLFDLEAVKFLPNLVKNNYKGLTQVLLVQVTSNKPHNHHALAAFKTRFPGILVRQYVWIDYHGFRIYEYGEDGKWKVW